MTRLLACLALATLSASATAPVSEDQPAPVVFRLGSPEGEAVCRGVVIGENVLTAHHCITDFQAGEKPVFMQSARETRRLDRREIATLATASFANQAASPGIDFNLFNWQTLGTPKPVPDLTRLYGRANVGEEIIIDGGAGAHGVCWVKATCGSILAYTCSPNTEEGWSGSPIFSADGSHRLVGIHSGAAHAPDGYIGPKLSRGIGLLTVVGRSGALFRSSEEFGNAVARSPSFAHRWVGQCDAIAPAVMGDSPLSVRTIASSPMLMHGLVAVDQDTLLAANIAKPGMSLCVLRRREGFDKWRCNGNPTAFADRVNAVVAGRDHEFAIGEALLPPEQRRLGDTPNTVAGAVSIANIALGEAGPSITIKRRVTSPVGSIYALRYLSGRIFAGGQDGVCGIAPGSSECVRVCAKPRCSKSDDWRVNGLLVLSDELVLAVGTDTKGHKSYPMAKWFRRSGDLWTQVSQIGPTDALLRLADDVENRRTGLQLKAPVTIAGEIYAFGSDGGAYELRPGGLPRPLGISRLWLAPEMGVDRRRMEDAVRDAIPIGPDRIAVASSDGSMHILRLESGSFVGDQALTAFDLGIWTTELAVAGNTLFVRSQDGNVSVVDLARVTRR